MVPVQYNPSLPEVRGDPYPLYRRLAQGYDDNDVTFGRAKTASRP